MENESIVILLVEDDPAHAEITKRNFRRKHTGNTIIHVSDGEKALDYLFRQGEFANPADSPRPHLILLDLRLPKVDGLEVLKKVKAHETLHKIPVVVLTTSEADIDISRAYELNVNSYLVKPLNFENFSEMIEAFGFYWTQWNKFSVN